MESILDVRDLFVAKDVTNISKRRKNTCMWIVWIYQHANKHQNGSPSTVKVLPYKKDVRQNMNLQMKQETTQAEKCGNKFW